MCKHCLQASRRLSLRPPHNANIINTRIPSPLTLRVGDLSFNLAPIRFVKWLLAWNCYILYRTALNGIVSEYIKHLVEKPLAISWKSTNKIILQVYSLKFKHLVTRTDVAVATWGDGRRELSRILVSTFRQIENRNKTICSMEDQ